MRKQGVERRALGRCAGGDHGHRHADRHRWRCWSPTACCRRTCAQRGDWEEVRLLGRLAAGACCTPAGAARRCSRRASRRPGASSAGRSRRWPSLRRAAELGHAPATTCCKTLGAGLLARWIGDAPRGCCSASRCSRAGCRARTPPTRCRRRSAAPPSCTCSTTWRSTTPSSSRTARCSTRRNTRSSSTSSARRSRRSKGCPTTRRARSCSTRRGPCSAQVQAKAAGDAVNASANQLKADVIARVPPHGRATRSARVWPTRRRCTTPTARAATAPTGAAMARRPRGSIRRRPTSTTPIACACAASTGCTTPSRSASPAPRCAATSELSGRRALGTHVPRRRPAPAARALRAGRGGWKRARGKKAFAACRILVDTVAAPQLRWRRGTAATWRCRARAGSRAHPAGGVSGPARRRSHSRAASSTKARQPIARGDNGGRAQAAIAAYLEGFELVEGSLDNVDAPLRVEVEREMMALRNADRRRAAVPTRWQTQAARIHALLDARQDKLSGDGLSPADRLLQLAADPAARRARGDPGAGGDHRVRAQDRPARCAALDPRRLARRRGARRAAPGSSPRG